jgi:transcriptional regulator with XRE-family HTH domain
VKNVLNGGLVRERRIAAGWSVSELARRLSVRAEVIWAIERGELLALRRLPVAALADLAELLDIPLTRLFDGTEAQPNAPESDATMLGAVLLRCRDGLTLQVLATGLCWSPERVVAALEQLADRLEGCGARLTRAGDRYGIQVRRGALPIPQWRGIAQAAMRCGSPDGPISIDGAVLLHRLLYGNYRIACDAWDESDATLLELVRQELVEGLGDRFDATAEVAYSQGLTDADRLVRGH